MPTKKSQTKKEQPKKALKKGQPRKDLAKKDQKKAQSKKESKKDPLSDQREANRLRQQRFLEKHRDEINEKRREKYAARKENGQCPRCARKLRSLKQTLCKDCLERAREYNQR